MRLSKQVYDRLPEDWRYTKHLFDCKKTCYYGKFSVKTIYHDYLPNVNGSRYLDTIFVRGVPQALLSDFV